jgi:hypothetical protein
MKRISKSIRNVFMMKHRFPFLTFAFSVYSIISSQKAATADSIHLSGIVQSENNQAIEGAEVFLNFRTNCKTSTDNNGTFELTCNATAASAKSPPHGKHPAVDFRNGLVNVDLAPGTHAAVDIYGTNGVKINGLSVYSSNNFKRQIKIPTVVFPSGIYLVVVKSKDCKAVFTCAISGSGVHAIVLQTARMGALEPVSIAHASSDFRDILVVSAQGTQTLRRPVVNPSETGIKIKLMPQGVGYITPGIPLSTEKGGVGDVTTYGSPSDPEYSQGGACNYGSTKIRYYAAINVNQFPGDGKGQWQAGQICGRCARVRVRTAEGEERTTIVRIVDKCPDDNCGIDLGGAPAAEIMKNQPGRYAGEWEWISCDSGNGVSDGSPSLYTKTGSNEWWSLVQARNGLSAVGRIRVRKAGTIDWQSLEWATEAENFFRLPATLLQDSGEWEIEVQWDFGAISTTRLPGNKLSIEDAVYPLLP